MAKTSSEQPPTCECGQVMFDVDGRKTGDVITCPWCDRKYQFYGGSHLELIKADGKSKPADDDDRRGFMNFGSSVEMTKLGIPDLGPKTASPRTSQRVTTRDKSGQSVRKDGQPRSKPPAEIPGGLMPMLGFMIGFNVLAFVALAFIMPQLPDGTRQAPWGDTISKKAMWPELVTLLVGHLIGFVAWAFYVYKRHNKKKDEKKEEEESDAELAKAKK